MNSIFYMLDDILIFTTINVIVFFTLWFCLSIYLYVYKQYKKTNKWFKNKCIKYFYYFCLISLIINFIFTILIKMYNF